MLFVSKPRRFLTALFFGAIGIAAWLLYDGFRHGYVELNDLQSGILFRALSALVLCAGATMLLYARREEDLEGNLPFLLLTMGGIYAMLGLVRLTMPLDWLGDLGYKFDATMLGIGCVPLFLTTVGFRRPFTA